MIFFRTIKTFLQDKEYRDLLLTGLAILIIGTLVYHELEGWSYLDAFYFSFITLTTIGFGDFAPQTDAGKVFYDHLYNNWGWYHSVIYQHPIPTL